MYKRFFKRSADIVISFGALLIAAPFIAPILFFVYLKTRENPFFFQKRPGLNEQIFTLIKMRTMANIYDSEGKLLPDKDRITRWGKFMREASIDEIPQLINVLKGDMSLIGPRPLLPQYLPLYSDFHRQRHQVRPGITGWAQINGRNTISWQQKFDLDVWYVEHVSFKVDMQIIMQTIKKVFKKSDINLSAEVTMPLFDGTN
jgi:lipopolysaccharide/colanic/teichoic acid biosynthesis glycosyltransferase